MSTLSIVPEAELRKQQISDSPSTLALTLSPPGAFRVRPSITSPSMTSAMPAICAAPSVSPSRHTPMSVENRMRVRSSTPYRLTGIRLSALKPHSQATNMISDLSAVKSIPRALRPMAFLASGSTMINEMRV